MKSRKLLKKIVFGLFLSAFAANLAAQTERPEMMQRPELVQRNDGAGRFELGQRLRAVEAAWDAHADPAARKRASLMLNSAVGKFFSAQTGDAGRALDQARFMLEGDVAPAKLWSESFYAQPAGRFLDTAATSLAVTLTQFYAVPTAAPPGAQWRVTLLEAGRKAASFTWTGAVAETPQTINLPVRGVLGGDFALRHEIISNGQILAKSEQTISFVPRLTVRLTALQSAVKALPANSTDTATALFLADILAKLARGETLETNFPAASMLAEAEKIVTAGQQKRSALGQKRAGEFWLSLQLDEKDALPVRLAAPQPAQTGQPLPLVIALHGAGGSENLFFDGYGRGAAARLAAQRGWLFIAPRNFGFNPERLDLLLDALEKLYPIDRKRVFLLGHSLGAMQAISLASNRAAQLAGVAALGGGGRPRNYEDLQQLPFFVGVGESDFALGAAKSLKSGLEQIGVRRVEFREYPNTEHLAIVQTALPDVYAFFDEIVAGK